VTLTATFVDLTKPLLLYFDFDDNNRLRVGNWETQVTANNIAYFKFASVVGFTTTSDSDTWGSGDIKFNPTSTANVTWESDAAGYAAIPGWYTTSTIPASVIKPSTYSITSNLDYVSTTVHSLDNVKDGYGDPCQLVGYTGAEINAMSSLPTATYRLPTTRENDTFVGYTGTPTTGNVHSIVPVTMSGSNPSIGTFSSGTALPAIGNRHHYSGTASAWGTLGFYLSSTPRDITNAYGLYFTNGNVHSSNNINAQLGFAVRCVPQ
jgi:hypothetical protein